MNHNSFQTPVSRWPSYNPFALWSEVTAIVQKNADKFRAALNAVRWLQVKTSAVTGDLAGE